MFCAEVTTNAIPVVLVNRSTMASSTSASVIVGLSGIPGWMFVPSMSSTSTPGGGLRSSSSKMPDFLPCPRMSPV